MSEFKIGDVLRYTPSTHHCRQGTAVVNSYGRVVDTFWGEDGHSEFGHLREAEIAEATLLFNINDYEKIGTVGHCAPSDEHKWLEYHPDDRRRIGSQGPHCAVLYVRKGATPDLGTKIENARQAVIEAESRLQSAQWRLEWSQQELAKLEAMREPR